MTSPLPGYPGLPIDSARTQHDDEGAIAVWTLKGLLVSRVSGKMTVARAKLLEVASEETVRRTSRYATFHDWDELTDYEIEARLRLVALGVRFRENAKVHLLVRSRIIVAAVDAARAILSNLTVFKTRAAFETELAMRLGAVH